MDVTSGAFDYFCSDAFRAKVFLKSFLKRFSAEFKAVGERTPETDVGSLQKWFCVELCLDNSVNDHSREICKDPVESFSWNDCHGNNSWFPQIPLRKPWKRVQSSGFHSSNLILFVEREALLIISLPVIISIEIFLWRRNLDEWRCWRESSRNLRINFHSDAVYLEQLMCYLSR